MATKRPSKPRRTLLQEASDPSTDPERLKQLARHEDDAVQRAAWRNPSLPEDIWRKTLLMERVPELWDNPMAPIYVFTWTPPKDDPNGLLIAAEMATQALWDDPERCSTEGRALIAAKTQEWWATFQSSTEMIWFLGAWAKSHGYNSPEHRKVVRILLVCVHTMSDLTARDHQAMSLLEAWSAGGEDQNKKAQVLASSNAVKDACRFARDPSYDPWNVIFEVLEEVAFGKLPRVEHHRLLADLIRREMPLPPVVE